MSSRYRANVNIPRDSGSEIVCNDIDEKVRKILYPLHLMQIIVLNPKFHIKKNVITTNNAFNKFILFSGLFIYLVGYMYRFAGTIFDDNLKRYSSICFLYFASYFDLVFYSAGFIMNVIIHCIQTRKVVNFILIFQEIHRFLNDEASFKWSIIRNWINVIIIFMFYIITVLIMSFIFERPPWYVMLNLMFLASLDTNLIYAICLIKLLVDKIELWKSRVMVSLTNEDIESNDVDHDRMLEAYVRIIKCYDICKNISQQSILYQTIETLGRCLVNIQVMIEFRRLFFKSNPLVSVFIYFWMIKTVAIQIAVSLQVETFYKAIQLTEDMCSSVAGTNCTDELKKLCKNIRRLHRSSFDKMSVCGMFYVDICLPLRLLALLTNYTVVLLQFAFL